MYLLCPFGVCMCPFYDPLCLFCVFDVSRLCPSGLSMPLGRLCFICVLLAFLRVPLTSLLCLFDVFSSFLDVSFMSHYAFNVLLPSLRCLFHSFCVPFITLTIFDLVIDSIIFTWCDFFFFFYKCHCRQLVQ